MENKILFNLFLTRDRANSRNVNINNMKNIWILFLLMFLGACKSAGIYKSNAPFDNKTLYQQSILSAMSPDSSKINTDLVPINHQNEHLVWKNIKGEDYILVVTWKQNVSYYEPFIDSLYYNTGDYPIWVTTAPELLQRMNWESIEDVNLRLKQLLGLPPNSVYNYFVEFWVKPSDLFRPCPDNEIMDSQCDLCFPDNTDSLYTFWVNANRISRYYQCELYDKYPWTQLGYTYDWSSENKTHYGLSEFVIDENKNIVVNAIYTTNDYLKKNTNKSH